MVWYYHIMVEYCRVGCGIVVFGGVGYGRVRYSRVWQGRVWYDMAVLGVVGWGIKW